METKKPNVALILVIIFVLVVGSCGAGFFAGRLSAENPTNSMIVMPGQNPQPLENSSSTTTQDVEQLFTPFWQAWKLVHQEYVDQPVNDTALMRGAIKGMIEALGDEHSSYIDPDLLKEFNAQLTGEQYEGIGAYVDTTREYLTIIAPMMDSPAEKAGLKAGDQIIAIDGQDMTGI
ncbi:MAG: S41 family peptidase, partial [Anaerolineales bacterium]